MKKLKEYKNSIWRVPLIALIAGYVYTPLYVKLVLQFGVIEPGVIDPRVSLLSGAGLLLATLVLGGVTLLRKQSKKEIFISAAALFVYGTFLTLLQLITNSTTGPAAVFFMYLQTPFAWTGFFGTLSVVLHENYQLPLGVIAYLGHLAPFCFVFFGRKKYQK